MRRSDAGRSAAAVRLAAGRCGALGLVAILGSLQAAQAQGPADLRSAFAEAFAGVQGCTALRDVAPAAETATSDGFACARRLPPCATLEIPTNVIALDRGVAPDTDTPLKRNPAIEGDPANGVTLRDAFRAPTPWVYEEVARRVGPDALGRALTAMRYGDSEHDDASTKESVSVRLSAVEQVEFLARLKRGELPTSAESQARTVEIFPAQKLGDANVVMKTGACQGVAWAVGWVERGQRSTILAAVETGGVGVSADDVAARTRQLAVNLGLTPPR